MADHTKQDKMLGPSLSEKLQNKDFLRVTLKLVKWHIDSDIVQRTPRKKSSERLGCFIKEEGTN